MLVRVAAPIDAAIEYTTAIIGTSSTTTHESANVVVAPTTASVPTVVGSAAEPAATKPGPKPAPSALVSGERAPRDLRWTSVASVMVVTLDARCSESRDASCRYRPSAAIALQDENASNNSARTDASRP